MFALAFDPVRPDPAIVPLDWRRTQLSRILAARQEVMAGKDLLYCSPEVRRLVEDEISILIGLACRS